ncbi:MAG TPA: UDP-N-acetylmuramoyl-tripeptide--D-alanyl-D-alanine ligase [Peptococcaceae bacterium]|nr:MAG: UDP-N-acetylmuramoyl-tripeptide--D-alanyl-D-alanine ligase [Moorella sp. 60_41]HBT48136.1 UDP-N-acetylmuramoyl-tripeptide--D-alanyl-D-alanine ligase [Peptococcaceae bacterium]
MIALTLAELCRILGAELIQGDPGRKIKGVSTDSRRVGRGELFFALKGERFDGHDYVEEALARGAAAAVVSRLPSGVTGPLLKVSDTLEALQALAAHHRASAFRGELIGVTGSSGKTTTKNLVAQVLEAKFKVCKTPGNLNNEIGLPLTLLQLTSEHEVAVLEMAMRGLGEIAALCRLARPTVGIITNIGTAHLGRLGSVDNIARAKGELLEALPAEGLAVLNGDDPWCLRLARNTRARVILYGTGEEAEVRAREVRALGREGTEFRAVFPRGEVRVRLPVPGLHNVLNSLAAMATGYCLGVEPEAMAGRLASWPRESMRQEFLSGPRGSYIYNDAYNANPESMAAALRVIAQLPGRKVAVLGDMLELGDRAPEFHRGIGRAAVEAGVSLLLTVGELAREIARGAKEAGMAPDRVFSFKDPREAGSFLACRLAAGDVVLLKGSRAVGMEQVLEVLEEVE